MKKILIVNVNWVGDVLFSTPLIRAAREQYPDAFIACLVVPRCKEVLELNPNLDEIIINHEESIHKGLIGRLKLIAYLRSKKFDTAILLHRSLMRALVVYLAGIRQRIGYYTRKRAFLLTEAVPPPTEDVHRVDYYLNLAKAAGITASDRNYEFFISDEDKRSARVLLEKEDVLERDTQIVINPGGNWGPKRWPKENFSALADKLAAIYKAKIIITGAKKDIPLAEAIAKGMKTKPVITCGRTSLKELASIFSAASLVIANDSGPMHIAVSLGVNTIALFGPTSPLITGPIGRGRYEVLHKSKECLVPCYNMSCVSYRCMNEIKVEDVLAVAKGLI